MDAKYLGVTLSNNLKWSIHIATMTNNANSKLSFLRRNLKGCPEKLKQTAYFSLIHSFMEYGTTVWDPYQKYISDKVERVQRRAARFVKSRYSRYSSVSDMLDVLGWTPLSQRRQEARLILFYEIINGLAQVPFKGVLVEAYTLLTRVPYHVDVGCYLTIQTKLLYLLSGGSVLLASFLSSFSGTSGRFPSGGPELSCLLHSL